MFSFSRRFLAGGIALVLLVNSLWADATQQTSEIDQNIAKLKRNIEMLSRFSAVRNADKIEAAQAEIRTLEKKKAELASSVRVEKANSAVDARLQLLQKLEAQIQAKLLELRYLTGYEVKRSLPQAEARDLDQIQQAYLTLATDYVIARQVAKVPPGQDDGLVSISRAREQALDVAHAVLEKESDDAIERLVAVEAVYRAARLREEAAQMVDMSSKQLLASMHLRDMVETIAKNDPNNFVPPQDKRSKWARSRCRPALKKSRPQQRFFGACP